MQWISLFTSTDSHSVLVLLLQWSGSLGDDWPWLGNPGNLWPHPRFCLSPGHVPLRLEHLRLAWLIYRCPYATVLVLLGQDQQLPLLISAVVQLYPGSFMGLAGPSLVVDPQAVGTHHDLHSVWLSADDEQCRCNLLDYSV